MQNKTVKKNIENKLTEWLDSIEDKKLAAKVKNKLLVSGGCIASMLLNAPVNDYDIYLQDIDVLKELCLYYCVKFANQKVVVWDGRFKEEISQIMNRTDIGADRLSARVDVAYRNLNDGQIKLYMLDDDAGYAPVYAEDCDMKYRPVFFSPNAISLSGEIQIICRFWGNHAEIHKNFDYIHATNYFTFNDGLVLNQLALESLLSKQLKYQGSLYPLTSIIRMRKFIKRGWNINAGEILKMCMQVSELNLKDPDVLEEQLVGVDIAFFSTLVNVLRGIPDDKRTSEYLNTVIDRVFNDYDEDTNEIPVI